jgi:hypothetical protein
LPCERQARRLNENQLAARLVHGIPETTVNGDGLLLKGEAAGAVGHADGVDGLQLEREQARPPFARSR